MSLERIINEHCAHLDVNMRVAHPLRVVTGRHSGCLVVVARRLNKRAVVIGAQSEHPIHRIFMRLAPFGQCSLSASTRARVYEPTRSHPPISHRPDHAQKAVMQVWQPQHRINQDSNPWPPHPRTVRVLIRGEGFNLRVASRPNLFEGLRKRFDAREVIQILGTHTLIMAEVAP